MSMNLELHAVNNDEIARLLTGDTDTCEEFLLSNRTSLDKAWDGIRFVLMKMKTADESEEVSHDPFGDRCLDAIDAGYGPATYLTPEEVIATSSLINKISSEAFAELIDAKAMLAADIYPIQQTETDTDVRDFLLPAFEIMKSFYADAASRKMNVVAVIR